ncbi:hypothetical protein DL93DRAFT_2228981 [Clavulina sp. PMI_390]|nr:hypothetical protein DL93DRAFT_2228981 [Clavulina sp. PMI_390]
MSCDPHDTLENYTIERLIGRGGSSKVYSARCIRGRLRGRRVALKIIPFAALSSPSHLSHHVSSTSLHTSLHHPAIVSLLSTFNTPTEYCQVLELCITTLSAFITQRTPRSLTESEARGVLKSVVDALMHLAGESILHRDIKADNILVSENGRVKLGDFGLAAKLEPPLFELSTFCGTPNYLSPEVVRQQPYGAASDLWALGCLSITILTGQPPFQGKTLEETFRRVKAADYTLPDSLSTEAKDFIRGLLQTRPERRTALNTILQHPFLHPKLPVSLLTIAPSLVKKSSAPEMNRGVRQRASQTVLQNKENTHTPSPSILTPASSRRTSPPVADNNPSNRPVLLPKIAHSITVGSLIMNGRTRAKNAETSSLQPPPSSRRKTRRSSTTMRDLYLQSAYYETSPLSHDELMTTLPPSTTQSRKTARPSANTLDKRDTHHNLTVHHTPEYFSTEDTLATGYDTPISKPIPFTTHNTISKPATSSHSLLRATLDRATSKQEPQRTIPPISTTLSQTPIPSMTIASMLAGDFSSSSTRSKEVRPLPLDCARLPAQKHETRHGFVEILPNHEGILLDLRASEMRAGRAGDDFLQISANGETIRVFSLATDGPGPSSSAVGVYSLSDLPKEYWKRYRFATRFVEMSLSRLPQFVVYTPIAKCSMMSNAPEADIELLIPGHASGTTGPQQCVRLSRRRNEVEFSHVDNNANGLKPGSSSTKRILEGSLVSLIADPTISSEDHAILEHVKECVTMCEKLESHVVPFASWSSLWPSKYTSNADPVPLWKSYARAELEEGEEGRTFVLPETTWDALFEQTPTGSTIQRGAPASSLGGNKRVPNLRDVLRGGISNSGHTHSNGRTLHQPPSTREPAASSSSLNIQERLRGILEGDGYKNSGPLPRNLTRAPPTDPHPLRAGGLSSHKAAAQSVTSRAQTPLPATVGPKAARHRPATSHEIEPGRGANIRFIPHLGRCIRRHGWSLKEALGTTSSGEGDEMEINGMDANVVTYLVMFLDGTRLEVDEYWERARMTDRSGKSSGRIPLGIGKIPSSIQRHLPIVEQFMQMFRAAE